MVYIRNVEENRLEFDKYEQKPVFAPNVGSLG